MNFQIVVILAFYIGGEFEMKVALDDKTLRF